MKRFCIAGIILVAALCDGCGGNDEPDRLVNVPPRSTPSAAPSKGPENSAGLAAIRRASEAGAHLFVFVHQGNSNETRETRDKFEAAVTKIGPPVQWTSVDRDTPSGRDVIAKYEIENVPLPIVLALAPNGAITGGLRAHEITEEKLRNTIVSATLQKCLKSLQAGRLVLLCVRDKSTPSTDPSWQGVNEFAEDVAFKSVTDIVQVDPADGTEKAFLKSLQIDSDGAPATTVFFAPPGVIVAKVQGPTKKEDLQRALKAATSGSG